MPDALPICYTWPIAASFISHSHATSRLKGSSSSSIFSNLCYAEIYVLSQLNGTCGLTWHKLGGLYGTCLVGCMIHTHWIVWYILIGLYGTYSVGCIVHIQWVLWYILIVVYGTYLLGCMVNTQWVVWYILSE